jgi:hypothetical protein
LVLQKNEHRSPEEIVTLGTKVFYCKGTYNYSHN